MTLDVTNLLRMQVAWRIEKRDYRIRVADRTCGLRCDERRSLIRSAPLLDGRQFEWQSPTVACRRPGREHPRPQPVPPRAQPALLPQAVLQDHRTEIRQSAHSLERNEETAGYYSSRGGMRLASYHHQSRPMAMAGATTGQSRDSHLPGRGGFEHRFLSVERRH
jgi:hypothetical protein